jgi:hypothetical protein
MTLAQSGNPKTDPTIAPGNLLPVKEPHAGNSCAAYGPDYVKVRHRDVRADQWLGQRRGWRLRRLTLSLAGVSPLRLDILVPVMMGCAMLWWVSRGMTWTTRLAVAAVTLVVIVCILLFERSGF